MPPGSHPMSPKQQRGEQTVDRLPAAALEVYADWGLRVSR